MVWLACNSVRLLNERLKHKRCCAGGLARSASVPIRKVRIRVPKPAPASPDADYIGSGDTTVNTALPAWQSSAAPSPYQRVLRPLSDGICRHTLVRLFCWRADVRQLRRDQDAAVAARQGHRPGVLQRLRHLPQDARPPAAHPPAEGRLARRHRQEGTALARLINPLPAPLLGSACAQGLGCVATLHGRAWKLLPL